MHAAALQAVLVQQLAPRGRVVAVVAVRQLHRAVSHLRTRISDKGMDYKGYNIAVHEFGHNVEQTISMYDVDNYMMSGVPNTGFTEALAFLFQSRDLYLLDITHSDAEADKMAAFDAAWSLMEIMGVGMVEMKVWKWLYENPEATPSQLKEATLNFSTDVWNKYFSPVFGVKDSPILAIYSHMVEFPLYLPNYAYGQIIENQIEGYVRTRKFSDEVDRIFKLGKLTPQQWMMAATGEKITAQPMIDALNKALEK
jgi:oligoendopeptidase F